MDRAIKTLIVDDEPVARQVLREELNRMSIVDLNLANGSQKFGNFISLSGLKYQPVSRWFGVRYHPRPRQ
jgi:CheY-like chemotaxis protein